MNRVLGCDLEYVGTLTIHMQRFPVAGSCISMRVGKLVCEGVDLGSHLVDVRATILQKNIV